MMTTFSMGRFVRAGMTASLVALASGAYAGEAATRIDQVMQQEIATAHARLQKATERIGCLVTATDTDAPAMSRILDTLNHGEISLREARRLAETAVTDDERTLAIAQARATLAFVVQAESESEQADLLN